VKAANTFVSWELASVVNIVHSPDTRDGKLHGNDAIVVPPTHLARVRLFDCEHTRALECMVLCRWSCLRTFSKRSFRRLLRAHTKHILLKGGDVDAGVDMGITYNQN
jgi:hypothetical protein